MAYSEEEKQEKFDLIIKDLLEDKYIVDATWIANGIAKNYLELKPLQSITDEDANRVAELWTTQTFYKIRLQKTVSYCFEEKMFEMPHTVSDYLRSKGYALPYMGLSVEQQIEYGWIKLKS